MNKKIILFFILVTSLSLLISFFPRPAFGQYIHAAKFLLEIATEYYQRRDYHSALHEFKKVLLINQGEEAEIAKRYIKIIEEKIVEPRKIAIQEAVEEAMEGLKREPEEELKREPKIEFPKEEVKKIITEEVLKEKAAFVELELNEDVTVEGKEISRWLSTSPGVIEVQKEDLDYLKVTAKKIGTTYLHIWDQSGRWTLNVKVIPVRYVAEYLPEAYKRRLEEEAVEPFKFTYSFDQRAFYRGKELGSAERQSLAFNQWLGLTGETPYGDFDTLAEISRLKETTDLTYLTVGLSDASVGGIEDFDIRGFDYRASFSSLSLPGDLLRGVRFDKSGLDDRLNYTAIWGRQGQGKYGILSPGLAEPRDAFIVGANLHYSVSDALSYRLSSFWGYGDEREEDLKNNVASLGLDYRIKQGLDLSGEIAYDSDNTAILLKSNLTFPRLRWTTEFRDIEPGFRAITGRPSYSGEIGLRSAVDYSPFDWLGVSGDFNLYQDRLFPNPNDPDRLNLDFSASSHIAINPTTSLGASYQYLDDRGKISPQQANTFILGLSKRFPDLKSLRTYINYGYRDSKNSETPTMDYNSNNLTAGLSFRLLGDISYYASNKISWLTEEYTNEKSLPSVFETGLDYSTQIFTLPIYTTLRFNYRNEENATAPHSFLSGEDSIECSGEISYRPIKDFELYISPRLKDIWAENAGVMARTEVEVRFGGRICWDTGISWNPIGSIEGMVYNDLNDDGVKQESEPGLENIKLFAGEREIITDRDGWYDLPGVRGRKASVRIDLSSLPQGFVLNGPQLREVKIRQGKVVRADFGLISRSEIFGIVFEDVDKDGEFGISDIGIVGVKLSLEDGSTAITDNKGQYYFRKVAVGDRTIRLEIDSVSLDYLPVVPIIKKITLFEGVTYIHNIPLKRAK